MKKLLCFALEGKFSYKYMQMSTLCSKENRFRLSIVNKKIYLNSPFRGIW
jgi:hypothetical protein